MCNGIEKILSNHTDETCDRYLLLKDLIIKSTSKEIDIKLWAKIPSFYVNEKFIRIHLFKDHINVVGESIIKFKDELTDYKLTPKGMLQIYHNQVLPEEVLSKIISDNLGT